MKLKHKEKKNTLIERIDKNYCDFKISLDGVSRKNLFEMAGRIAAVTEAYEILTTGYRWEEMEEIEFFLLFRNPLIIIADAWEIRKNETAVSIENALFDIGYSDKILSEYPLIDGVDEKLYDSIMSFHD
jgi:hypothetical protein